MSWGFCGSQGLHNRSKKKPLRFIAGEFFFVLGRGSEEFQKPQPLLVSKKVLQYTSNLYGGTPPICIAVPSLLLSMKKGKHNSAPPICTAVRLPFLRQYAFHLYGSTGGWGHRKALEPRVHVPCFPSDRPYFKLAGWRKLGHLRRTSKMSILIRLLSSPAPLF